MTVKTTEQHPEAGCRVVFMGTPDFAVPALNALHESRHRITLVVTQPDRPRGRGRSVSPPPVKKRALALGYPVVQPERMNDPEFMDRMRSEAPDVLAVIAFGHILHQELLDLPRLGPVNLHGSLLPGYRGSAPIQWAVINGEKETGVTSMLMARGMDTGDMLIRRSTPISAEDTSASLHDRLSAMGAEVMVDTIDGLQAGILVPEPQDNGLATYAPLLKKSDGCLNWEEPAWDLDCRIRGTHPWPGAYTFFGDRRLKIFSARALEMQTDQPPGTVLEGFPDELWIACGKGILAILELQGASGKRMKTREFLCGCCVAPGARLTEQPDCECVL